MATHKARTSKPSSADVLQSTLRMHAARCALCREWSDPGELAYTVRVPVGPYLLFDVMLTDRGMSAGLCSACMQRVNEALRGLRP